MADENFDGLAMAVGVQTAFGTPNATIAALSGTIDETDGCVLGDRESGDAESGITAPELVRFYRGRPVVDNSFTETFDTFRYLMANGFSITYPVQGNGATATPTPGEATLETLFPGYEALLEMKGLIGAAGGANCEHDYTPRHSGSTDGYLIYGGIKLWHGDLSMVFDDCLVESSVYACDPGQPVLCTDNIRVGSMSTGQISDGVTFPTISYDFMEDTAAPVLEGVAFAAFGQTRDFENLTITIENGIEERGASNVAETGKRLVLTYRRIKVNGTLYINASDSDAEIQNLISTSAPTADLSFQVGDAQTGAGVMNAFKFECNNLHNRSIKYNRIGQVLAVTLNDALCTATTAGGEFTLVFN